MVSKRLRMSAHLFFHVLGFWLDLGAEAVHLLSEPLTDPGNFIGVELVQVLIAKVHQVALAAVLFQDLADVGGDGKQHSMVSAMKYNEARRDSHKAGKVCSH